MRGQLAQAQEHICACIICLYDQTAGGCFCKHAITVGAKRLRLGIMFPEQGDDRAFCGIVLAGAIITICCNARSGKRYVKDRRFRVI